MRMDVRLASIEAMWDLYRLDQLLNPDSDAEHE